MNNGNVFQSQPPLASVVMTPVQQNPSTSMISTTISNLQTLSPATIVRAVFAPPNSTVDQHTLRQPAPIQSQFNVTTTGPTYVFPIQQILQNPAIIETSSSSIPSAPFQHIIPAGTVSGRGQQQKKSQSKPRQPKVTKKPPSTTVKSPASQNPPKSTTVQYSGQTGSGRVNKKQQEKEEYYNRKFQLLKKCIRSLVFKNAALCDEVARLHQRIATVDDERKTLLKRLLHHERLKVRRKQTAETKKAQQAAAAAAALANASLVSTISTHVISPSSINAQVNLIQDIDQS